MSYGPRMDLTPEEMRRRGLLRCPKCSQTFEEKAKHWHKCLVDKHRGQRAAKTRVTNRLSSLKEQEKMLQAREIAVRRILFRQQNKEIALGMKIDEERVHTLIKSNAYKIAQADLDARVSEREKAAFEHVEKRMIEASDVAADRILEILRGTAVEDKTIATLAKLSTDVLKMRGHEKPKEQRTEIQVSLSPDTIALMRRTDEEFDKTQAIDLASSDYSHVVDFEDSASSRKKSAPVAPRAPVLGVGAPALAPLDVSRETDEEPEPPNDFTEEQP